MLDKHGGCNINQSRCRGKFLKLRRRLGDERRIGIQVAQTLAYNHVVDVELGVQAARNAREHNGLRSIFADEMLRCGSGINGTHTCRRCDHGQTVKLTAYNGQARLLRHVSAVQFFFNLRNLFFERTDDCDGRHTIPQTCENCLSTVWYQHFDSTARYEAVSPAQCGYRRGA
jgi:hypothetical protein